MIRRLAGAGTAKQRLAALIGAGVVALAWPLVQHFEGRELEAYRDPVGIWTACDGITEGIAPNARFTYAQCDELLASNLFEHEKNVVERCVKVPLNDGQRAAFTSFAVNVGPGRPGAKDGFCTLKSGATPTFLAKLNAGDYRGACLGLRAWTGAKGRTLPGLVKRRQAEAAMCLGEQPLQ